MKKTQANNMEIQQKNQNELRQLEQFYNTNEIDTMNETIEERKAQLVEELTKFKEEHTVECKWDSEGFPTEYKVEINPLVINNYFFKSIVPITSQEPLYNAERLGMVFDYYCEIIAKVNDIVGKFPSSLTSFCKFAGITMNTLRNYKNSQDYSMRTVVEKIYDQIGDDNITMSQLGMTRERSTIFKMKAQNEMVEKQQPNININITEKPDMEAIKNKLDRYNNFARKKDR